MSSPSAPADCPRICICTASRPWPFINGIINVRQSLCGPSLNKRATWEKSSLRRPAKSGCVCSKLRANSPNQWRTSPPRTALRYERMLAARRLFAWGSLLWLNDCARSGADRRNWLKASSRLGHPRDAGAIDEINCGTIGLPDMAVVLRSSKSFVPAGSGAAPFSDKVPPGVCTRGEPARLEPPRFRRFRFVTLPAKPIAPILPAWRLSISWH